MPEDGKKHEWFKLGINAELEASSELLRKYPSPTAFLVYGDECEKLITDYLTSLRKHADSYFKSHFGSTVSGTAPREYIITVPGIWSDKAHYRSRICAEKAGMGNRDNIQIISEPEAAGIYALDSMTNIGLTVDDTFVVCAAGGGYVFYNLSSLGSGLRQLTKSFSELLNWSLTQSSLFNHFLRSLKLRPAPEDSAEAVFSTEFLRSTWMIG